MVNKYKLEKFCFSTKNYKDNRSRNGEMENCSKQFTATALLFNSEKKTFPLNEKKYMRYTNRVSQW